MNEVPPIIAGPGLRVGEYVLDEKIGQGAFGEVWRAHHRAWTDQLAAAKIPTDPSYLRQLRSEGFSLHRLNHPNIVRVIGFDPSASPPYLMTELVDGSSLREMLKNSKPNVRKSVAIVRQILSGLSYAHQNGVVHGDLKPENVLLDKGALSGGTAPEGSVKLTDFGVGLVAVAAVLGSGSSSRLLHGRSGAVSTLAYVAPEQREGAAPDARCDLFACGVMLFELLTGERPAGAESPSEFNPDVPPGLDDAFRHAYARRDRRYTSALEFLTALDSVADKLPGGNTSESADSGFGIIALRRDDSDPGSPKKSNPPQPPAPAAVAPPVAAPLPPPPPAAAPPTAPPTAAEPDKSAAKPPPKLQRTVMIMDELARQPLKSADDLRETFRRIHLTRAMDQGEVGNLRIRMDHWAETAGGLPGFGERIEVTEAVDCPYHRVVVKTTIEVGGGGMANGENIEEAVILANPAAAQDCGNILEVGDFVPFVHLSTGVFPTGLLEMIPITVIRLAVANLLASAKTRAGGRPIVRQELKLSRATVLSIRYVFDSADHGICFAGTSLKVVAPTTPLTRMRDELLKRAAALLDTDNIGAGIAELRQMFLTPNPAQPRAERMLVALRAKLSAAYMSLARATGVGMGVFESLAYSDSADELLPDSEEAAAHVRRVQRQAFWIHVAPGFAIGLVFAVLAGLNLQTGALGYVAAAIGAAAAGVYCWIKLRISTARTDVAFCHACLLPLAVAAILATTLRESSQIVYDLSAVVLVGAVLFVDWMIFRKFGDRLLRSPYRRTMGGAPLEILNQVQTMLEPDWDKLRGHYVSLDPLYKHASAQIVTADLSAPAQSDQDDEPSESAEPDAEDELE